MRCQNRSITDAKIPAILRVRLAPNDKPGNQKDQGQKNRRGQAQPEREAASLDLREIPHRSHMRCVGVPEPILHQDPSDDAAVNQDNGKASHFWNDSEEEVLLFD